MRERGVGAYSDGFESFFELGGASGNEDDVGSFGAELLRDREAHAFGSACDEDRLEKG